MATPDPGSRLEALWAGSFGDAYAKRNTAAGRGREDFWQEVLGSTGAESVLEVGCNIGGNLQHIAPLLEEPSKAAGIDVNQTALAEAARQAPGVDLRRASAYEIPHPDEAFDLVFTTGVLIHLPTERIGEALDEIVRCSRRYILCGEYFAAQEVEVPYRDQTGALFKRDYGRLYLERHPGLSVVKEGFLPSSSTTSWDDVTWWLLERE